MLNQDLMIFLRSLPSDIRLDQDEVILLLDKCGLVKVADYIDSLLSEDYEEIISSHEILTN